MHCEIPMLCGEYQNVIGKLRLEGYSFSKLDDSLKHGGVGGAQGGGGVGQGGSAGTGHGGRAHIAARSLFCLREPSLFVDVLQVMSPKDLRKDAQSLMTFACTVREKIRTCMAHGGNCENASIDVFRPLLDIVRSPSISATTTGEALAVIHRLIVDYRLLSRNPTRYNDVVDGVVECVFRQTETGDDEIAIMWALEVLEACVVLGGEALSIEKMERVFVTIYKNSVTSANADMLRKLAIRKLSIIENQLFGQLFSGTGDKKDNEKLEIMAARMFKFLCRRIDPNGAYWHDMDSRQTCLELILTAITATIDEEGKLVQIDRNKEIHAVICDDLFRALLQTCQNAGDIQGKIGSMLDGNDMVKVVSLPSLQRRGSEHSEGSGPFKTAPDPFAHIPTTFDDLEEYLQMRGSSRGNQFSIPPNTGSSGDLMGGINAAGGGGGGVSSSSLSSSASHSSSTASMKDGARKNIYDASRGSYLNILSYALRIIHILFAHKNTRKALKVQMQAFYNSVFLRALETKSKHSSDNEARRLVLETLTDLFADPTNAIDLYCNFDCSLNSTNVFENLFVFLSNHSFPRQLRKLALDTLQLMSLRCIHIGVRAVALRTRIEDKPMIGDHIPTPASLLKTKVAKRRLRKCAMEFNRKPKAGIAALIDAGILSDPPDPAQLAAFLRNTQGLDKPAIGQFLGTNSDLAKSVLEAFVATFNMKGLRLLDALRMFLESFRLPGEAQMIDRIINAFSEAAHVDCCDASLFPTADCAYLLTFSIILLNTDLHNPNIRPERKMTFESFKISNLNYGPDVSKGQDMPMDLLISVYEEIKAREINTMSDGSSLTSEVTTDRWRDIMQVSGTMTLIGAPGDHLYIYDKQMFATIQKPAFAALSVVYHAGDPTKQPRAVEMALEGIIYCAETAAHYRMIQVLDRIVVDVCKFTTLLLYAHATNDATDGHRPDEDGDFADEGYDEIEDEDPETTEEDDDDDDEEMALAAKQPQDGTMAKHVAEENGGAGDDAVSVGEVSVTTNGSSKPDQQKRHQSGTSVRSSSSSSGKRRGLLRDSGPDLLGSHMSISRTFAALKNSVKAQTATDSVFELAKNYGDAIRLAWPHIIYCLLRLFDLDLLPSELVHESHDAHVEHAQRVRYHRRVAGTLLKEHETRLNHAKEKVERTKGWVSWLSGESQMDAEVELKLREEEMFICKRAITFCANSLSRDAEPVDIGADMVKEKLERIDSSKVRAIIAATESMCDMTLQAMVRGIILACCGDETSCPDESAVLKDVNYKEDFGLEDDGEGDMRGDIRVDMLSPPSRASRLFGLQMLSEIVVLNLDKINGKEKIARVKLVWPMVKLHLLMILRSSKVISCHVEKASVGLLRIAIRLLFVDDHELREDAATVLRFLLRYPADVAPELDNLVCMALVHSLDDPKKPWNPSLRRLLVSISQLDDFRVACIGIQVLRKLLSSQGAIHDITHAKELVQVCQGFLARTISYRKWVRSSPGSQQQNHNAQTTGQKKGVTASDDGLEEIMDLLNLLFILHTQVTEKKEFEQDISVLTAIVDVAVDPSPEITNDIRMHVLNLLQDACKEYIESKPSFAVWEKLHYSVLLRYSRVVSPEDAVEGRNLLVQSHGHPKSVPFPLEIPQKLAGMVVECFQTQLDAWTSQVEEEDPLVSLSVYSVCYVNRFGEPGRVEELVTLLKQKHTLVEAIENHKFGQEPIVKNLIFGVHASEQQQQQQQEEQGQGQGQQEQDEERGQEQEQQQAPKHIEAQNDEQEQEETD